MSIKPFRVGCMGGRQIFNEAYLLAEPEMNSSGFYFGVNNFNKNLFLLLLVMTE